MVGPSNFKMPTHCLYADDIMLFCKGTHSNLQALSNLFDRYSTASSQLVNPLKSTIFSYSIPNGRLSIFSSLLGFNIHRFPFTYLGVPIFKGKPKASHLSLIIDKAKAKLSTWKASLLPMAGRVQLVKSILHSMLIYSITIYAWSISIIKDLEKALRNFIWSGNKDNRNIVIVSWCKVYQPFAEEGIVLRSTSILNEACNLKLCWELFTSQDH